MARRTKKYNAAVKVARELNFTGDWEEQNEVYRLLNENHYVWNSKSGEWENYQAVPANPPTDLVKLRVWAGGSAEAKVMASFLKYILERCGLEFIEMSEPYVCRPPDHNDYRVYLTMKKKPGQKFAEFYNEEAIASGQPPPFSLVLGSNTI